MIETSSLATLTAMRILNLDDNELVSIHTDAFATLTHMLFLQVRACCLPDGCLVPGCLGGGLIRRMPFLPGPPRLPVGWLGLSGLGGALCRRPVPGAMFTR